MARIDPLERMGDGAALGALREHQRAARASAQPWLTLALAAALAEIGLFLYALFHHGFRDLALVSSLLIFVFGLSSAIAGLRVWLFRRAHPFELIPTPSVVRWHRGLR